jgi:hypothetical protein
MIQIEIQWILLEENVGTDQPEQDVTQVLEPELASQSIPAILRLAVQLRRVDILVEASMMSSHLCQPRVGHLEVVYNIFLSLEKRVEANMAFNDKIPRLDETAFHKSDWSESIYGKVEEKMPPNAPQALGNPVMMTCFIDAYHAGDKITRGSQTGFIIYLTHRLVHQEAKHVRIIYIRIGICCHEDCN